jgi:microcystin-dependent protein
MAKTALRRGSQEEGNSEYFTGCPIGGGFMWFGLITKIPSNCRVCDNSTLAIASFAKLNENLGGAWGVSGGSMNIPDLRGKFPRGVDGGAANDPDAAGRTANATGGNTGDAVGSVQSHSNAAHTHFSVANQAQINNTTVNTSFAIADNGLQGGGNYAYNLGSGTTVANASPTNSSGGNETRPKNANVYFVIRVS